MAARRLTRRDGAGPVLIGLVAGLVALLLLGLAPHADAVIRDTADSCPTGEVPEDGFTDVPADNVHESAIDCIVWWQLTQGTTATTYSPSAGVTRAQMATFVARLVDRVGMILPASPPNAFDDDDGNVHELAINQMAAVGIVSGTGPRQYSPNRFVNREQMASLLARAYEAATDTTLVSTRDHFTDDNGSVHEPNINKIAENGFSGGTGTTTYSPQRGVLRDSMASFLARALDKLVEDGETTRPGASSTSSSSSSSSSSTTSTTACTGIPPFCL
ncbi:MAG: S-layer homology domain-containing protein [Actinomycetota bacterium]